MQQSQCNETYILKQQFCAGAALLDTRLTRTRYSRESNKAVRVCHVTPPLCVTTTGHSVGTAVSQREVAEPSPCDVGPPSRNKPFRLGPRTCQKAKINSFYGSRLERSPCGRHHAPGGHQFDSGLIVQSLYSERCLIYCGKVVGDLTAELGFFQNPGSILKRRLQ